MAPNKTLAKATRHITNNGRVWGGGGEPSPPNSPINKIQDNKNINTAGGGRIHQQRISRGTKQITVQGTWRPTRRQGVSSIFKNRNSHRIKDAFFLGTWRRTYFTKRSYTQRRSYPLLQWSGRENQSPRRVENQDIRRQYNQNQNSWKLPST